MLDYENRYKKNVLIAGLDEVGRGCLAGPVVCAAVIMPLEKELIIDGINDSKKLTAKERERLDKLILEKAIAYSISIIDKETIDEINILEATKLGMKNAVENLKIKPNILLIDAVKIESDIKQENIIKGDEKSYNIACASIIAKVYRDNYMKQISLKYPLYNFAQNKGYGTREHIECLLKNGPCQIHRKTFISKILERGQYLKIPKTA